MTIPEAIGEVVVATSVLATAQCHPSKSKIATFPEPPPLGSFVSIPMLSVSREDVSVADSPEEADPFVSETPVIQLRPDFIYGVVSFAQTSSLDPGRRPTAYGIMTEGELRRMQPQLFELLTTEFVITVTSYTDDAGVLHHGLPTRPARIHSQVFACGAAEATTLTEDFGFLRSMLSGSATASGVATEDLVSMVLQGAVGLRTQHSDYLVRAGKAVLKLTSNNYDLFQAIMGRLI